MKEFLDTTITTKKMAYVGLPRYSATYNGRILTCLGVGTYVEGEDHDHEPPVLHQSSLVDQETRLTVEPDVIQKDHVLDCHGFSLDRLSDPCLHLWLGVPSSSLRASATDQS